MATTTLGTSRTAHLLPLIKQGEGSSTPATSRRWTRYTTSMIAHVRAPRTGPDQLVNLRRSTAQGTK